MAEQITYEIFEIVLAVLLFLTLFSAVFLLNDANFLKAKTASIEGSYIASQVSGTNMIVEVKYDEDYELSESNNQVLVEVKSKEASTSYYGEKINIGQEGNIVTYSYK